MNINLSYKSDKILLKYHHIKQLNNHDDIYFIKDYKKSNYHNQHNKHYQHYQHTCLPIVLNYLL